MNLKQIGFIDDKYINLATVYLKHNCFISTITEIIPVSFLHHVKYISFLKLFNPNGWELYMQFKYINFFFECMVSEN